MAAIPNNEAAERKIDWADFPYPNPPLGITDRVQKVAGSTLLGLAACSGAGGVAVALAVTAAPIVIVSGFGGMAVLSVALAAAGVYFLCKAPPENDPEVLKNDARLAGQDIQTNQLGYDAIYLKYGHLIDTRKINVTALKDLIHQDAQNLSYANFKLKHGSRLVFDFINDETKQLLKNKFLEYVAQNGASLGGANDVVQSMEARALGATFQEIAPLVVHAECASSRDYQEFVERNSREILQYITEPEAKKRLSDQFLEHIGRERALGPSNQVQARYASECLYLEPRVGNILKTLAFEQEKRLFLAGILSYPQFRERNDFARIQQSDQDFLERLRASFLTMPYEQALRGCYKEDRQLLGIDTQELDCIHIEHMNAIAKELPYLGANGFKAKYGTELFHKKWIIHDNILKYRQELWDHLLNSGPDEMHHLAQEMAWFDIAADDILIHRWTAMSLQQILLQERENFFAKALALFSREELVLKFLQHFDSVRAMLQHCPEVFSRRIVLPHDALDGQRSLSGRLEEEIRALHSLEELNHIEPIFQHMLLPLDSPKLKALTMAFITSHARELLTGNAGRIWDVLNTHDRVPGQVDKPLVAAREKITIESTRHRERLQEINQNYSQALRPIEARKNTAINRAAEEARLDILSQQVANSQEENEKAKRRYSKCTSLLHEFESLLAEAKRAYETLIDTQYRLNAEVRHLQPEVVNEVSLQIELRQAEQHVEQIERKVQREIGIATRDLVARRGQVEVQLRALQANYERLTRDEESLQRQVQEIQGLQRRVNELASIRERIGSVEAEILQESARQEKPVTGLWSAVTNLPRYNLSKLNKELASLQAQKTTLGGLEQKLARMEPLHTLQGHIGSIQEAKRHLEAEMRQFQNEKSALGIQETKLGNEIGDKHNLRAHTQALQALQAKSRRLQEAKVKLAATQERQRTLSTDQEELKKRLASLQQASDRQIAEVKATKEALVQAQASLDKNSQEFDRRRTRHAEQVAEANVRYTREEAEARATRDASLVRENARHEQNFQETIDDFCQRIA